MTYFQIQKEKEKKYSNEYSQKTSHSENFGAFLWMSTFPYAEDFGILNCFFRNWEASESLLWHNILNRVLESAPSLPFPPCISRPLADFKSSINSRVCKIIQITI